MAATIFPRFLELPRELQIQVWQEAIMETIHPALLMKVDFGVHYGFTYNSILARSFYSLTSRREETSLAIPFSSGIMGACRFSRLIACEWWKRMLSACTQVYDDDEDWLARDIQALDELIEDLNDSLSGGPSF